MVRYLLAVLILIFGALASIYFWIGVPRIYKEKEQQFASPHMYKNPERAIKEINIAAFYFIPRNKLGVELKNWKEILETNLRKLQEFHALQFQGRSRLSYEIYQSPVAGLNNNLFYDTLSTARGNPKALLSVAEELEKRVFDLEGDLFISDFFKKSDSAYPVLFILYEGVGASGGVIYESELETVEEIARSLGISPDIIYKVDIEAVDGFFMVGTSFLATPHFNSTLAHEFYHTLGIADEYEALEAARFETIGTQDIMGGGRKLSLDKTYLDMKFLQEMGFK